MQGDLHSLLGIARIYDQLNDVSQAVSIYRQVLSFDSSNVEAISCLASNYFYTDQPELALRLYRRLLQMGLNAAELWNNLGLCCFHAGQYDMCLVCFERALAQSEDDNSADIWYNVGQLAIGIGDLGLAYQAFKIAVSVDVHHAESFNNLGVLELRKHNPEAARSNFEGAHKLSEFHFEPLFNAVRAARGLGGRGLCSLWLLRSVCAFSAADLVRTEPGALLAQALLSFKLGDFQQSFDQLSKAIALYPEHNESQELLKQLKQHFALL